MCVSRPHLWPWLQIHGFLPVGNNLACQRFYSDLFTAPRQAGKEGAFITAVMGHSVWQEWGNQDVCVVTARHSYSTAREPLPMLAPEQEICESSALGVCAVGKGPATRSQQETSVPKRRCCRAAAVRGSAVRKILGC